MWFISYFIMKPAWSSSEARLAPKKIRKAGLSDERLPSFFEVVNYLHTTYDKDDTTSHAVTELESYKRCPGTPAALYLKKLYTKALCFKIVYKEWRIKPWFVEKLDESVCDNIPVHLVQHPAHRRQNWSVMLTR